MKEIHTEIEIHAPADHVWQILMDFRMFAEWNPFIPSIKGEMKKGERIEVFLKPQSLLP